MYLDDIIIFGSSIIDHANKLKSIFDRLRLTKVLLQPDKCKFMRHEGIYLDHIINQNRICLNPNKIRSITEYPVAKSQKQIKQFFNLIGYYRLFIENFSQFAKPPQFF